MNIEAVVTGGAGFIGSHVAELLIREGIQTTIIDDFSTGVRSNVPRGARLVEGSILNKDLLRSTLTSAHYVFHLAALPRIQPSFDAPQEHELVNVMGTIEILMALRGSKQLRKLVVSASSACYGTPEELPTSEAAAIQPLSPYALQKYAAEQYALLLGERHSIPVVALRYFNVYGPRSFNPQNPQNAYSSVLGIFHNQRKAGKPLTVTGDGSQQRDFVHVHDVARANLLAAKTPISGQVYNVGAGAPYPILDIARMIGGEITYIPERQGEARITWASISKIERDLGWKPEIDVARGLQLLE